MKIAAVSDLHGFLDIEIEESELLIIAGDICPSFNETVEYQGKWIEEYFIPWLRKQPVQRCYIVPGNHDYWFERNRDILGHTFKWGIKVLIDSGTHYYDNLGKDWCIYGIPYCQNNGSMAFSGWNKNFMSEKFLDIPGSIDILVTHDTPRIIEFSPIYESEKCSYTPGNEALRECLEKRKPRYNICGHIHIPYRSGFKFCETTIYNVSQKEHGLDSGIVTYLDLDKDF